MIDKKHYIRPLFIAFLLSYPSVTWAQGYYMRIPGESELVHVPNQSPETVTGVNYWKVEYHRCNGSGVWGSTQGDSPAEVMRLAEEAAERERQIFSMRGKTFPTMCYQNPVGPVAVMGKNHAPVNPAPKADNGVQPSGESSKYQSVRSVLSTDIDYDLVSRAARKTARAVLGRRPRVPRGINGDEFQRNSATMNDLNSNLNANAFENARQGAERLNEALESVQTQIDSQAQYTSNNKIYSSSGSKHAETSDLIEQDEREVEEDELHPKKRKWVPLGSVDEESAGFSTGTSFDPQSPTISDALQKQLQRYQELAEQARIDQEIAEQMRLNNERNSSGSHGNDSQSGCRPGSPCAESRGN